MLAGPPPSRQEAWCAWFGDVGGETLYFGVSAFWGAFRASGGDPRADLQIAGPRQIGRFDLERESFREPLAAGPGDAPGGVWDVLVHPDGHVWFTTFFGLGGRVDPQSGRVRPLAEAGLALNELALGPGDRVVASRYLADAEGRSEVLLLARDGTPLRRLSLRAPSGLAVAAKSVAWDPVRDEIWVNTDLLDSQGQAVGHDARVLDAEGHERLRIATPEIQFMAFSGEGTGWLAEREAGRLWLRILPAQPTGSAWPRGHRVLLDPAFASTDFVQEIRPAPDGSALLTRWSGRVHRVWSDGRIRSFQLPRDGGELYYTGVLHEGRLCATRCGSVDVVCRNAGPESDP